MNLEEIVNDDEVAPLLDLDTIPDPNDDPYAYEFFENTIYLLKEKSEEKRVIKEKEKGYTELGKIELYGLATSPFVFSIHESLHALAGYISGAYVGGFGYNEWGLYTKIYGTQSQIIFTSLFPHLLAIPAMYYTFFKKKIVAVAFLAPTLAELIPAKLWSYETDFGVAAENINPNYVLPIKYAMLGGWLTLSYLISRFAYRRNLKKK